jgi:dCMP deaminase
MNWNEYFFKIAHVVMSKSKDPSTKVGAVIVGPHHEIRSTGYNDLPRGMDDSNPKYRERPLKYDVTVHAERNAIYNAARVGVPTNECVLYLGHSPLTGICSGCAQAIIQAGITHVIGPNIPFPGKGEDWKRDCTIARHMLAECGVILDEVVIR